MPDPSHLPRVALITGGAKRVGRAIVQRLHTAGFDVAFTYFSSKQDSDSLVKQLTAAGQRKVIAIRADLTDPDAFIDSIHEAIAREFGRLDVLVNNASLYQPATLQQTNRKLMQQFAAIHVQSPLLLCQKFEPMLRASRGHVINMVDFLAERPWPQYLAYSASKAALSNLTLGLARELAPDVTVNGIAPGVVDWPDNYPQADREQYLKRVPLARAGTPLEVADTVHFLVTTGSYITGQIIRLDGGRSIT
jgi:pteridine reductase